MKKTYLALSAVCVLFTSACQQNNSNSESAQKTITSTEPPNVIVILADDLGYGDLGVYGATKVKTPNIDKLAQQGRMFTDAHSVSAVCSPSRYAFLTGEYPYKAHIKTQNHNGAWGPISPVSKMIIKPEQQTLADVFKQKGYKTAAIGKWHLGFKSEKNDWSMPLTPGPRDLGFDYYYGIPLVNSGPPYVHVENEMVVGHDPDDPLIYLGHPGSPLYDKYKPTETRTFPPEASNKVANRFAGGKKAHALFDDEQLGVQYTHKALQWIESNKHQPFFLYFATTQIHHPFTPAPRFKGTSEIGLYGDFIHELDWMVGEIVEYLEKNNLADNTLIVFASDNGGMLNLGARNAYQAGHKINGDLLGFKFGAWEGGHRIPMITYWPNKIKPGQVSNQLVSLMDMYSSFAHLTGQTELIPSDSDSINALPALLGTSDEPVREELLIAPRQPKNLAVRDGKWVYIPAQGSGGFSGSKPHHHAWGGPAAVNFIGGKNSDMANGKLLPDAPAEQLYDLVKDPYQTTNIAGKHPEIVAQMKQKLNELYQPEQN
ncbi:sulfatase-like hydrolase/transferase [Gayadomonas joobiniege]|uniref:sulfatase-like hydrolase/transferase n=1 Tax=Gayadomonas joobiniege TaxID=1234606 RepID=UPI0003638D4A|nr:sulfatase-like hydrolase/transferase [Gayadomonas joobiniege]